MSAFINRRILPTQTRERLKREIDSMQRELKGELVIPRHPQGKEEGLSERRMGRMSQFLDQRHQPNKHLMQNRIEKLTRVLQNGSPEALSKSQKARLDRQIQTDREYLRSKMCPQTLFKKGYKDPDFERAKSACAVEHSPEFQKVADRYQNAVRQIDPEDPKAASLERLRPE